MTERPDHIEAREFTVSWRGYDRDEVRGFLREVAVAVRGALPSEVTDDETDGGEPKLHDPSPVEWPDSPTRGQQADAAGPVPETIEVREFSLSWRGYDRDEVRTFLREVADTVRGPVADDTVEDDAQADAPAVEVEAAAAEPPTPIPAADDHPADPVRAVDDESRPEDDDDYNAALAIVFGDEGTAAEADDTEPIVPDHDEPAEAAAPDVDAPVDELDVDTEAAEPATDADVEVAVAERAAAAAMAVRADARRASKTMRNRADAYLDEGERRAAENRRQADDYATEARREADLDALAVRTRLTQASNARMQARARRRSTEQAVEPEEATPAAAPVPPADLRTRQRADLNRLGRDLAQAHTTIARLEAELSEAKTSSTAPASAPPTRTDAPPPTPRTDTESADIERRRALIEREEQRLATVRAELESLQANVIDQRAEVERLRLEAQRHLDEAADERRQTGRSEATPSEGPTPDPEAPADPQPARRPGEPGSPSRPISRTAPPGLGLYPAPTDDEPPTTEDALADMVREALDTGLPADEQ
ncbi:MAG: DivIVA domain-containing protein [Acidimicrobiales bacterium]